MQTFALKVTVAAVTEAAGDHSLLGEKREDEVTLQTERRVTLTFRLSPSSDFPTWAPVSDSWLLLIKRVRR